MSIRSSRLIRTSLTAADLTSADLTNADLRYAHLELATLDRTILKRANLEGLSLTESRLVDVDLFGALGTESVSADQITVVENGIEKVLIGTENIRAWLKDASKTKHE